MKKTEIMKEAWLKAKEDYDETLVDSLSWKDDDFRWIRNLPFDDKRQLLKLAWVKQNTDTVLTIRFHFRIAMKVVWELYNEGFYEKYGQYSRLAKLKNARI